MTYRLGIDIGADHTVWATVSRDGDKKPSVDGAKVESIVALVQGRLGAGAELADVDPADLEHVTRGFVAQLGDATPLFVGGTPYGAESLIASLVTSVVDEARKRRGGDPAAVVVVHEDGLDEYRTGLLTEAARVAGIPLTNLVLVARSEADAATSDKSLKFPAGLGTAVGASLLGWIRLPDTAIAASAGGEAGAAAGGVALGAGGGALGASSLAGGSGAAAVAGPAGTSLGATAGPAGTSLASAGPAGTSLGAAAGPAGTPLGPTAGPAGTPLGSPPGLKGKFLQNLLSTPKAIAVAAVAATAAVATVVVVATGDDSAPATTAESVAVTIATEVPEVAEVESLSECTVGTWTMDNEGFKSRFESAVGAGGAGLIVDITGTLVVMVAPDGLWTLTHDSWTVTLSSGPIRAESVATGVDTLRGDFRDDGTFTYSEEVVGSTQEITATFDGAPFPGAADFPTAPRIGIGSGTYTCSGDTMRVATNTDFSFDLNRTA